MADDIGDGDLLLGAQPIARFLTRLFDGEKITATDVYNWCSRGALPHSKLGAKIVGSKTRIREHFYAPRTPISRAGAQPAAAMTSHRGKRDGKAPQNRAEQTKGHRSPSSRH